MKKLSYLAYFINHFVFVLSWLFLWIWSLSYFSFSNLFSSLKYPSVGIVVFGIAMAGLVYSLVYLLIYEILGRLFKKSLGSLLVLPALLRINKYYMGSFGGGGGPSFKSVSLKYNEWIKENGVEEKIKIKKRKKNIFVFSILFTSLVLFLIVVAFL